MMANPVPRVIDLSHHNSVPESFFPAKEAGIVGVIHKLTEGSSYVDDKVLARHYLTKDAGLAWGVYHFLRPGNMDQQAQFFVSKGKELGIVDDQTLWAADHEDAGVTLSSLMQFLKKVQSLTGRAPIIYSGHVIKDQCKSGNYPDEYRLWLAQYSSSPSLPAGCDKYWMWQYTDQGTIAGVTPPTDLNDIGATPVDEFLAEWLMTLPKPVPPKPTIPMLTISSNVPIQVHVGPNITIV